MTAPTVTKTRNPNNRRSASVREKQQRKREEYLKAKLGAEYVAPEHRPPRRVARHYAASAALFADARMKALTVECARHRAAAGAPCWSTPAITRGELASGVCASRFGAVGITFTTDEAEDVEAEDVDDRRDDDRPRTSTPARARRRRGPQTTPERPRSIPRSEIQEREHWRARNRAVGK